jgi:hypothetical protein
MSISIPNNLPEFSHNIPEQSNLNKPSKAKNTKIAKTSKDLSLKREILNRFVDRMEPYKKLDYTSNDNKYVDVKVILDEKFISKKLLNEDEAIEEETWTAFRRLSSGIETKLNAKRLAIENKLLNLVKVPLKKASILLMKKESSHKEYRAIKNFLKQLETQQNQILNRFQKDVEKNMFLDENMKYSIYKIVNLKKI